MNDIMEESPRPAEWRPYPDRIRSSHWYELFLSSPNDARKGLTWKGLFRDVNFYSTQEEVVNNGDGDWHPITERNYVWYNQETRKGVWPLMLHEYDKEGRVTLWKKKNPQPMIAHGVGYENDEHPVPRKNGRHGFDMMKYDWLPPLGKGEVADFYFIRRIGEEVDDGVWGWLEFPEKCGMYTGKQTGCKNFPSTNGADTNAVYKSRIPFIFDRANEGKKGITYKDILNEDEYGVLRTRVVCDARGNIIKANYSKVLGPFRFGDWCGKWVILTRCAVFNPRVNDPNLESDPEHSYDPKVKRPLLAP